MDVIKNVVIYLLCCNSCSIWQVFMNMIHKWDDDERASWAMKQIQEYVGCCGASGNR
jgi:hypothetical protein